MTIIAAVRKGDLIVVASDSQTNWDTHREHTDNVIWPKVRRFGSTLIGSAGWAVYDNILEHYIDSLEELPAFEGEREIFEFFCDLRLQMKEEYGFVNDQCDERKDSPFSDLDATFLLANPHGIFGVTSQMSVARYKKYHAIGGGSDYAVGALHTLYEDVEDPEELARRAVQTAIHFDIYCGGDIDLHRVEAVTA